MDIFNLPAEASVKRLLSAANLNSSDLTPEHMEHFFGTGAKENLDGVVGLELFNTIGLLRSLAVVSSRRRTGLDQGSSPMPKTMPGIAALNIFTF